MITVTLPPWLLSGLGAYALVSLGLTVTEIVQKVLLLRAMKHANAEARKVMTTLDHFDSYDDPENGA